MHDLMMRIRRFIEGLLPWYDPQAESARDRHINQTIRAARQAAREVGAYGRVKIH